MSKSSVNDISLEGSAFAVVDTPGETNTPDKATGQILALTKELDRSLKYFRENEGYPHPGKTIDEELADEKLSQFARFTTVQMRLDHRWVLPIKLLVLTNRLSIPTSEVVAVTLPNHSPGGSVPLTFTVTVNRKMTLKQLAGYLAKQAELEDYLDELNDSVPPGTQDEAMRWGSLVWRYKEFINPGISYQQIHDLIPDPDIPDRATLGVYYRRFLAASKKHRPRL